MKNNNILTTILPPPMSAMPLSRPEPPVSRRAVLRMAAVPAGAVSPSLIF